MPGFVVHQPHGGHAAGRGAEPLSRLAGVVLDRRHADLQRTRDFLFLHVTRDQPQYLLLPFGQRADVRLPVHQMSLLPRRHLI